MKSIKYIILLCLLPSFILAQKPKIKNEPDHDDKPLHFGFSLGVNFMDFSIEMSEVGINNKIVADVVTLSPGFNVHAISNFRLLDYLDLRITPGISFGGVREINYVGLDATYFQNYEQYTPVVIESNFIELPFMFKYRAKRINNFGPYLIGGIDSRIDLGATKKTWGESNKDKNYVLLNVFDYYYELGLGFECYLNYFNFSIEMKYCIGMSDVLKKEINKGGEIKLPPPEFAILTNSIDKINSRIFMISLHFE